MLVILPVVSLVVFPVVWPVVFLVVWPVVFPVVFKAMKAKKTQRKNLVCTKSSLKINFRVALSFEFIPITTR